MSLEVPPVETWRSLDGSPADRGGEPELVFSHVSDLHGQLTPRYQVYDDNATSKPDFEFGDDDRVVNRAGGLPRLAAKLSELRDDHEVCTLMSGDTFHGSAEYSFGSTRHFSRSPRPWATR